MSKSKFVQYDQCCLRVEDMEDFQSAEVSWNDHTLWITVPYGDHFEARLEKAKQDLALRVKEYLEENV